MCGRNCFRISLNCRRISTNRRAPAKWSRGWRPTPLKSNRHSGSRLRWRSETPSCWRGASWWWCWRARGCPGWRCLRSRRSWRRLWFSAGASGGCRGWRRTDWRGAPPPLRKCSPAFPRCRRSARKGASRRRSRRRRKTRFKRRGGAARRGRCSRPRSSSCRSDRLSRCCGWAPRMSSRAIFRPARLASSCSMQPSRQAPWASSVRCGGRFSWRREQRNASRNCSTPSRQSRRQCVRSGCLRRTAA